MWSNINQSKLQTRTNRKEEFRCECARFWYIFIIFYTFFYRFFITLNIFLYGEMVSLLDRVKLSKFKVRKKHLFWPSVYSAPESTMKSTALCLFISKKLLVPETCGHSRLISFLESFYISSKILWARSFSISSFLLHLSFLNLSLQLNSTSNSLTVFFRPR